MKQRLLSLVAFSLASLLLTAFVCIACQKPTDGNWRDEVTSVMDQLATTTAPTIVGHPSDSSDQDNLHPLTNPDADVIPSVSYGNKQLLLYGNKVYAVMHYEYSTSLLCSVNLSEMVNYDPQAKRDEQFVPPFTPVCFDPFCQHFPYDFNDDIICPIYFDLHKSGQSDAAVFDPIFCIDYSESKGESPVFYICAAEPEYRVVGGQVIFQSVADLAIYRYDPATGERKIVAEDLSSSIYQMDICGNYIIYGDDSGLTAMDKSGNVVGTIPKMGEDFSILDRIDGVLYIADSMGTVYTANEDLSRLQTVYIYDYSDMDESMVLNCLLRGYRPVGMTIANGYLYYCDDHTEIEQYKTYSSSIYRIPLRDFSADPELVVDDICYASSLLGIADGVLYFTPTYRRPGTEGKNYWHQAYSLASVDLSTLKVTIMEEAAFDMPGYVSIKDQRLILTSEFIVGPTECYNAYPSLYILYHFASGDIMYIDQKYASWEEGW